MSDDCLKLVYCPLDECANWDSNPKQHDIGLLSQSLSRHGMKDPIKFEPSLNNGQGGIVEGNGRIITLRMMKQQGAERPRGIAKTEDGDWAVPVLFGVDAESEAAAEAYGLDHNSLVMAGGDFSPWDMARIWDNTYTDRLKLLAELEELPVSVDGDDLDALLQNLEELTAGATPSPEELEEQIEDLIDWNECPECGHKWPKP